MASPFWKYFHDALHWPQIFHPGPLSAMAKGLALYMDGVREDILWLRRQWTPATADEELIERYGASRGIYRQRFDTDQSFRARVVNAYAWHHLGGKVRGLERIFAENGLAGTEILPASLPELWAHFRVGIDVTGREFSEDDGALAWWLANEYKPARSKIEDLLTHSTNPLPVTVALAVVTRNSRRTLIHFPASAATPLAEVVALGSVTRNVLRGYIHFAAQKSPNGRAVFGLGAVAASASRSRMFFSVPEVPAHDARIAAGVAGHSVARNGLHFPVEQPVPVMARQPLGATGHSRVRAGLHFPALPAPRGKSRRALAPISFTRSYLCPTQ